METYRLGGQGKAERSLDSTILPHPKIQWYHLLQKELRMGGLGTFQNRKKKKFLCLLRQPDVKGVCGLASRPGLINK